MKKVEKLVLFLVLFAVLGFFVFRKELTEGVSRHPLVGNEQLKTSAGDPLELERIRDRIELFLELKPGHCSSTDADGLMEDLLASPAESVRIAREFQAEADLSRRLMGLYIELELEGFSAELKSWALAQDSLNIAATTAEWLYLNHEFDQWSEFLSVFAQSIETETSSQLFAYLDEPGGDQRFPPVFSLLNIGEAGEDFVENILRRNQEAQRQFGDFLVRTEVTPMVRNSGLDLLRKIESAYFEGVLNHFLLQYPPDTQTYQYLLNLRGGAPLASAPSLQPHIEQVRAETATRMLRSPSVEVLLTVIEDDPSITLEDDVLEKLETFLRDLPLQTHHLQKKAADVAHARWQVRTQ